MHTNQYHILNGDALAERFPSHISGECFIVRECLIDFPCGKWTYKHFFEQRAAYLSEMYAEISIENYAEIVVPEFEKMAAIPPDVHLNLWFEEDVFCQVNLWFVVYFLLKKGKKNPMFLIRPNDSLRYGFGGLGEEELGGIYKKKIRITQPRLLADLWEYSAMNDSKNLRQTAEKLYSTFPFMETTVAARLNYPQGAISTLKDILKTLPSDDFNAIFKAFSAQAAIYGLGDLQVKRLMNE